MTFFINKKVKEFLILFLKYNIVLIYNLGYIDSINILKNLNVNQYKIFIDWYKD